MKKEEDIKGGWGPQKAPSGVQGQWSGGVGGRCPPKLSFFEKIITENDILEVENNKLVT